MAVLLRDQGKQIVPDENASNQKLHKFSSLMAENSTLQSTERKFGRTRVVSSATTVRRPKT